jgi:hypothetical protein
MKVSGMVFPNWESDLVTNDHRHICSDSILKDYGSTEMDKAYIGKIDSLKRAGILFKRTMVAHSIKEKQISQTEAKTLLMIRKILINHNTRYYIVITPLYDQLKFNDSDLELLTGIFGRHIYDFSGINEITNNEYNFLDGLHFRPCISKQMIDSILDQSKRTENNGNDNENFSGGIARVKIRKRV